MSGLSGAPVSQGVTYARVRSMLTMHCRFCPPVVMEPGFLVVLEPLLGSLAVVVPSSSGDSLVLSEVTAATALGPSTGEDPEPATRLRHSGVRRHASWCSGAVGKLVSHPESGCRTSSVRVAVGVTTTVDGDTVEVTVVGGRLVDRSARSGTPRRVGRSGRSSPRPWWSSGPSTTRLSWCRTPSPRGGVATPPGSITLPRENVVFVISDNSRG